MIGDGSAVIQVRKSSKSSRRRQPRSDFLSSADAAVRLGVGVSAVKRWADAGVLRVLRTAGGHRRFDPADLDRMARGGGAAPGPSPWSEWIDVLVESGDVHAVLGRLFSERSSRGGWSAVAEHLGRLLGEIGERWADGRLSVVQEHIASSALQRAIAVVVETMPVPAGARRCLLACAEGEEHTIGLSLAELCLREAGWRAEWIGSHTRSTDVCERVRTAAVDLVGLSASAAMTDRRRLRMQERLIGSVCQRAGIPLALGGTGNWPDPPAFGVRVRRWAEFTELLRDSPPRAV